MLSTFKTLQNSPKFEWIGDFTVPDRRSKHKCYNKFKLSGIEYAVGDHVLIRDDDSMDPEELRNCYIGRIKTAFDTGNHGQSEIASSVGLDVRC